MFAWDTANVYEDAIVHEIIRQPIAVYGDTFFGTCSPQIPEEYRKNMNPKIKSLRECSDASGTVFSGLQNCTLFSKRQADKLIFSLYFDRTDLSESGKRPICRISGA